MIKVSFAIFIFLNLSVSKAEDLPPWAKTTPVNDSKYKYYVGRSSNVNNEEDAYRIADRNARELAIRGNYDSFFSIQSTAVENLSDVLSSTRIDEQSSFVNLRGFERVEDLTVSKKINGSLIYSTYILYRYDLLAIQREQNRLAQPKAMSEFKFNETGDQSCPADLNSVLEIKTPEPGAAVFIDGEMIGRSPLRVSCQLSVGKRLNLLIDHPKYDDYSEEFTLSHGQTLKFNALMNPASVDLTIDTQPSGARVSIDGVYVGQSPTSPHKVLAGTKLQILLTHDDAERSVHEIEIPKEPRQVHKSFELRLKPAFVRISSQPKGASIEIDGEALNEFKTPTGLLPCKPGTHQITLSLPGYVTSNFEVDCKAGKTMTAPIVKLISRSNAEERLLVNGPTWSLGGSLGLSQSTLSGIDPVINLYGLKAKYQATRVFGFSFTGEWASGETKYSDATLKTKGISASLGIVTRLYQTEITKTLISRLSITPLATWSDLTYSSIYNNGPSKSSSGYKQNGFGGALSYTIFTKPKIDDVGFFCDFDFAVIKHSDSQNIDGKIASSLTLSTGLTW